MKWDFSVLLLIFVVVSGVIWAFDSLFLAPKRRLSVSEPDDEQDLYPGNRKKTKEHRESVSSSPGVSLSSAASPPIIVDYAKSFFPIFLLVLLLRSFVIEPFRIPSNSMMPNLLTGDFIVVNKFTYGIRLPVINHKVIDFGTSPERGDVLVFRYPGDNKTPFIKRVIGLPGDIVRYHMRDKIFSINEKLVKQTPSDPYIGEGAGSGMTGVAVRNEYLTPEHYKILVHPVYRSNIDSWQEWEVPEGHYFVLGDNRDNSRDSRSWGFVPDENVIGRAFLIWLHFDWKHRLFKWRRIGQSIH